MSPKYTQQNPSDTSGHPLLPWLLHSGFALTGVGTVLLGTILPRVSSEWHLRDKDAGLVLLVQFAASATGALFTRRHLWRTLSAGYGLCCAAAIAITLLPHDAFFLLLTALGVFGLGLGLTMTSTNLLVSRRYTHRRGAALALLNFSWSLGAVACPLVVGRFFPQTSASSLFGVIGLLMCPFAMLPALANRPAWQGAKVPSPKAANLAGLRIIAYFALLAFLYVGVEATIGNWLSTYSTRVTAWNPAGSSTAVAVYWATLLLGRGLTPWSLNLVAEPRLYQLSTVLVVAGVVALLSAHSAATLFAGAAITGLALAPLFPLTISLFLAEAGETQNAGWVFALAGWGGAALSWLTGVVSTSTGSLRNGLFVPGGAALLMAALIAGRKLSQPGKRTAGPSTTLRSGRADKVRGNAL